MAIHFYGCESQVYTPAQITRFNALHYKVLRQIFQIKNSFYHRVLQPSDAECSNAFLLQLPYVHAPRLLINSQRISVQRLRYLGHILRHFDSLEHKISFNTSHSLHTISSPFRIGRPSVHWPEIAMSEAYHRYLQLHNGHSPSDQEVHHPLYEIATSATVQPYFGPSLIDWPVLSFNRSLICSFDLFLRFVRSFVHSFIPSFFHLFFHLFIHLFFHMCVRSFVLSFVR